MKKILFYINEPGAANVIEPLIEKVQQISEVSVHIIASSFVRERLKKYSLNLIDSDNFFTEKKLNIKEYRLVITGASFPPDREIRLWQECSLEGVLSIAILDQWMHYRERFCLEKAELLRFPSMIGIMDNLGKKEMLNEGFPEDVLYISGHPYLESVQLKMNTFSRNEQSFSNILFLAEPRHLGKNLGYNEHDIFEILLKGLEEVYFDKNVKLTCKLHPRHKKNSFDRYKNVASNIDLMIDADSNMKELINNNDIIIGMSSVSLIEATLLKKPIISLQVGLNTTDPFLFSRTGVLDAALSYDDFLLQLKTIIAGKYTFHWEINKNASNTFHERVLEELKNF